MFQKKYERANERNRKTPQKKRKQVEHGCHILIRLKNEGDRGTNPSKDESYP